MTFDSSPSPAATAAAVRADASAPTSEGAQGGEDARVLASLLADPSAVSSDQPGPAVIPAASLRVEEASELASSDDAGPDEPGAASAVAMTEAMLDSGIDAATAPGGGPGAVAAKTANPSAVQAQEIARSIETARSGESADAPCTHAERVETPGSEGIDSHATHSLDGDPPHAGESPADVIHLPDRSGIAALQDQDGFDDELLRGIGDAASVSSDGNAPPDDGAGTGGSSDAFNDATGVGTDEAQSEEGRHARDAAAAEPALPTVTAPSDSGRDVEAGPAAGTARAEETARTAEALPNSTDRAGAGAPSTESAFADVLLRGIGDASAVSSDGEGSVAETSFIAGGFDRENLEDRVAGSPSRGGKPVLDTSCSGDEAGFRARTASPEEPSGTTGALPDSTVRIGAAAPGSAFASGLLRTIVEASSVSSDQAGAVKEASVAAVVFDDEDPADRAAVVPAGDGGSEDDIPDRDGESGLEAVLARPGDAAGTAGAPSDSTGRVGAAARASEPAFADTLMRGIADAPAVSSDGDGMVAETSVTAIGDEGPEDHTVAEVTAAAPAAVDPALAGLPPGGMAGLPASPVEAAGGEYGDISLEAPPPGPAAALAFATDMDTEVALRDGLFGYESPFPDCADPQVWQGGLRAAIAALSEGHSAPLILVDIDGIPYPAGAIHELAAVCEEGTTVVAIGSDGSARPGRDLLLAGVSDYLAKPLSADAVRSVAERVASDEANVHTGGSVAGFVGTGGSGATTLATLAALNAASRGCYVTVLDLNRPVAAAALALGVEPASGLDQLLEASAQDSPEPEMVEGVCARRSDRIEVFGHRWSPAPAGAPTPAAVDRLLAALRQRSQLVLVDGFDEPSLRFSPSAAVNARVMVAEPIAGKAAHLPRMMDMLATGTPLVFVQNHTRPFRRGRGARALREAGLGIEPDVLVPFERSLPGTADRGWPQDWLPRSLRKPVAALTDRLMASPAFAGAAVQRQLSEAS